MSVARMNAFLFLLPSWQGRQITMTAFMLPTCPSLYGWSRLGLGRSPWEHFPEANLHLVVVVSNRIRLSLKNKTHLCSMDEDLH